MSTTVTTYFDGFFSEAFTLTGATSDIDRLSIESNINKKYSVWDDTFSGICDTVSTKAYQAHSLRKLRKLYTGPCLLVRRTVTGTTRNVFVLFDTHNTISLDSPVISQSGTTGLTMATTLGGFANSTGYGNPDSLSGGQTIFVVTWYNQSGTYSYDSNFFQAKERDATQATTTQQPKIVITGTLVTSGGKVAMAFQRSQSNILTILYNSGVNQAMGTIDNLSTFWVGQYTGSTTVTTSIGFSLSPAGTSNRWWFPASHATLGFRAGYGSTAYNVPLDTANTGRRLYEMIAPSTLNPGYVQTWANGATNYLNTTLLQSAPASGLNIGGSGGNYFDGYIQEIITWETIGAIDNDAKRQEIESNINTYWDIYP